MRISRADISTSSSSLLVNEGSDEQQSLLNNHDSSGNSCIAASFDRINKAMGNSRFKGPRNTILNTLASPSHFLMLTTFFQGWQNTLMSRSQIAAKVNLGYVSIVWLANIMAEKGMDIHLVPDSVRSNVKKAFGINLPEKISSATLRDHLHAVDTASGVVLYNAITLISYFISKDVQEGSVSVTGSEETKQFWLGSMAPAIASGLATYIFMAWKIAHAEGKSHLRLVPEFIFGTFIAASTINGAAGLIMTRFLGVNFNNEPAIDRLDVLEYSLIPALFLAAAALPRRSNEIINTNLDLLLAMTICADLLTNPELKDTPWVYLATLALLFGQVGLTIGAALFTHFFNDAGFKQTRKLAGIQEIVEVEDESEEKELIGDVEQQNLSDDEVYDIEGYENNAANVEVVEAESAEDDDLLASIPLLFNEGNMVTLVINNNSPVFSNPAPVVVQAQAAENLAVSPQLQQ